MLTQNAPIFVFVLVTLSIAALLLALFQPQLAGSRKRLQRMALALGGGRSQAGLRKGAANGVRHRSSVEHTLREIATRQKVRTDRSHAGHSLTRRLRQGGLEWSLQTYWGLSAVIGLIVFAVFWLGSSLGALVAVGIGAAVGLLLPHFYVVFRRNQRFARFGAEFPNAIDSIVRGVKAGMPVGDCMRVVAAEAEEPVRTEFKLVMDNETLGMPVSEAIQRLSARIPSPETRFFAIVITIQSQTGGNLAEALDNLSNVLRARKKMHAKIRSMSSEAKSSAAIIASLPVVVCVFVYFMSPDYISLLFETTLGNIVLAACGAWMLIGVQVMRKMINFDF